MYDLFSQPPSASFYEPSSIICPKLIPDRASIPRAGQTFGRRAEALSKPLRDAIEVISTDFDSERAQTAFVKSFAPRFGAQLQPAVFTESLSRRAAWILINIWILHGLTTKTSSASFEQAEEWFFGQHWPKFGLVNLLRAHNSREALRILDTLSLDQEFAELLPYVLEPIGAGSRFSVMKDQSTQGARVSKKYHGVYYTPHDVATYMVGEVARRYGKDWVNARCLDPACGTGVFLLALVEKARTQNPQTIDLLQWMAVHLYGLDINPLIIESSVFVLLQEALKEHSSQKFSPFAAWHLLRVNFAATDAIRLRKQASDENASRFPHQTIVEVRAALTAGLIPEPVTEALLDGVASIALGQFMPDLSEGCDILIGNPPYGDIGERAKRLDRSQDFLTFRAKKVSEGDDIHLFFVEMMWSLTKSRRFSSSLVVPLSIAFNRTSAFRGGRVAMMAAECKWRFAFFDREPHALFGEDVKTRNAILFAYHSHEEMKDPSQSMRMGTTKLMRWTSRNRGELFTSVQFTLLGDIDIRRGIPKLSGEDQARMYWSLRSNRGFFARSVIKYDSASLSTIAKSPSDDTTLLLGPTAYNFLNVFFGSALQFDEGVSISENKVHRLHFQSNDLALAGYAVLASRLIHWLWTVEGDGFHVSRWFLEELPICLEDLTSANRVRLSELGAVLWSQAQSDIVRSVNKAKHSTAFRPIRYAESRDRIDEMLCNALSLPYGSQDALRHFTDEHIMVDRSDLTRIERIERRSLNK